MSCDGLAAWVWARRIPIRWIVISIHGIRMGSEVRLPPTGVPSGPPTPRADVAVRARARDDDTAVLRGYEPTPLLVRVRVRLHMDGTVGSNTGGETQRRRACGSSRSRIPLAAAYATLLAGCNIAQLTRGRSAARCVIRVGSRAAMLEAVSFNPRNWRAVSQPARGPTQPAGDGLTIVTVFLASW